MRNPAPGRRAPAALAASLGLGLWLATVPAAPARAAAEVRLDRDFLSGLVEKLPPAPFKKDGQYRGSVRGYRLTGIDPKGRRLLVACEVSGAFRPPVAGAVRRAVTPPSAPGGPAPGPAGGGDGWKAFAFDVRAAVRAEPGGPDGAPRFTVDIEEVKRRELEGVGGLLAKVLGRHFDALVTQVADGKAALLSEKVNARLRKKIEAFKEYGVLRAIDYTPDDLVLTFDVTKYRADGVAGHVFPASSPVAGSVPLYRWVRPRLGDRFYTTRPDPPAGHPYYVYETLACHVFDRPAPGTVALNRWRGPREWVYATAPDADAGGLARRGYRPEAVACYVYDAPAPGTVPLYRFVDPRGLHFYSVDPHAEFLK